MNFSEIDNIIKSIHKADPSFTKERITLHVLSNLYAGAIAQIEQISGCGRWEDAMMTLEAINVAENIKTYCNSFKKNFFNDVASNMQNLLNAKTDNELESISKQILGDSINQEMNNALVNAVKDINHIIPRLINEFLLPDINSCAKPIAYSKDNPRIIRLKNSEQSSGIESQKEKLRKKVICMEMASILMDSGRYFQAWAVLSELIKENPRDTTAYITRARCFMEMGASGNARQDLIKATLLNPPKSISEVKNILELSGSTGVSRTVFNEQEIELIESFLDKLPLEIQQKKRKGFYKKAEEHFGVEAILSLIREKNIPILHKEDIIRSIGCTNHENDKYPENLMILIIGFLLIFAMIVFVIIKLIINEYQ